IAGIGLAALVVCTLLASAGAALASGPDWWPPTLRIEGSTTVDPIVLAAEKPFEGIWTNTMVTVDAPGTGAGIRRLQKDESDIAMASRLPRTDDPQEAGPHDLDIYLIGRDALAVIVRDVPEMAFLTDITGAQLKKIYEGDITRWNQGGLGGPDEPIEPRARIINSGTRDSFHELVEYAGAPDEIDPGKEEATIDTPRLLHNDCMVAAIAANTFHIGYVGLGFIGEPGIRAVPVKGVMPSPETVKDGTYPMSRSLYLITLKDDPTPNARADDFINYMFTAEGQAHVAAEGFVPIPIPADPVIRDYDVNKDNKVTMADLVAVFPHWDESNVDHHGWVRADVNNDGEVKMADLMALFPHWGASWADPTEPWPPPA
ncbi:substrate-binding domain-containing protein, partial [Dehalococcoidia bacterium]|nr:substrate-binding domain-containing protein [Dehalococcoidia bacterium]